MPSTKQLREERATIPVLMRAMVAKVTEEKRKFTPEEDTEWERMNADYNERTKEIERLERLEAIETEQRAVTAAVREMPGRDDETGQPRNVVSASNDRMIATGAWFKRQMDHELTEDEIAACKRARINPARSNLYLDFRGTATMRAIQSEMRNQHPTRFDRERLYQARAMSALDGPAGGYTVPDIFLSRLEVAMLEFGGMLQTSEIMQTDNGQEISWPTANDTSNKGRRTSESAAITTDQTITIGVTKWNAYPYTTDAILVPSQLLEDSAFDLAAFIAAAQGERLGRIFNEEFTTGTGESMPYGIVTRATSGKTTASATAITFSEIVELVHSVDPAYRNGARFMFHDAVLLALRKVVDGEGRPLWQDNVTVGAPDTLWGYPFSINQDMASSVAASATTMLFGQLNAYKARLVRGIRFYRLQELYRANDQDGFVAFARADGNLLDAGTHPVKKMVQHS